MLFLNADGGFSAVWSAWTQMGGWLGDVTRKGTRQGVDLCRTVHEEILDEIKEITIIYKLFYNSSHCSKKQS